MPYYTNRSAKLPLCVPIRVTFSRLRAAISAFQVYIYTSTNYMYTPYVYTRAEHTYMHIYIYIYMCVCGGVHPVCAFCVHIVLDYALSNCSFSF